MLKASRGSKPRRKGSARTTRSAAAAAAASGTVSAPRATAFESASPPLSTTLRMFFEIKDWGKLCWQVMYIGTEPSKSVFRLIFSYTHPANVQHVEIAPGVDAALDKSDLICYLQVDVDQLACHILAMDNFLEGRPPLSMVAKYFPVPDDVLVVSLVTDEFHASNVESTDDVLSPKFQHLWISRDSDGRILSFDISRASTIIRKETLVADIPAQH